MIRLTLKTALALKRAHDSALHDTTEQGSDLSTGGELEDQGKHSGTRTERARTEHALLRIVSRARYPCTKTQGCTESRQSAKLCDSSGELTWVPEKVEASKTACRKRMPMTCCGLVTTAGTSAAASLR